jgi:hypothetical protein
MGNNSPYAGGRFTLELDDKKPVGFVTSIDGGHFKADAVQSPFGAQLSGHTGGEFLVDRFPGKPKYEDITITVGMAMSPSFWKWVEDTVNNKPSRRNGALVGYDFNNKERSRRTFYRALISEIGFPALDAGAKQSAQLTIKFSPEALEWKEGDGSSLRYAQALDEMTKQKTWLTSNFALALNNFPGDRKISNVKVEAFTVKQNVIVNSLGPERESRREIGRIDLPSLQVTFPEANLDRWMKWYKKSAVEGNYEETPGAVYYYASNMKDELMRIELDRVGLTSLEVEKYEAHKEGIAKVKATLYIGSMKLVSGQGTA